MLKKYLIFFIFGFGVILVLGLFLSNKIGYQNKTGNNQPILPKEINLTVIEGWSIKDISEYLQKNKLAKESEFEAYADNFPANGIEILKYRPSWQNTLEGFLYPDTYRVYESASLANEKSAGYKGLVNKMLVNFAKKIPTDADELSKKQGLTVYESLTLASIVEKESGRDVITSAEKEKLEQERKIIAGIFYNRLKAGVALQSDATINYITNKNEPSVLEYDLKIDSPFNTYKYKGLPPAPICSPSISSINAVLNPAKTEFFYFLHKQPSGEPVYSKTFEEHVKNKFKYLK